MGLVAKAPDDLQERYVKRFLDALDVSDKAVYAVHERIACNAEFYSEVFNRLPARDRAMIKDAIGRHQAELPVMLANGRAP